MTIRVSEKTDLWKDITLLLYAKMSIWVLYSSSGGDQPCTESFSSLLSSTSNRDPRCSNSCQHSGTAWIAPSSAVFQEQSSRHCCQHSGTAWIAASNGLLQYLINKAAARAASIYVSTAWIEASNAVSQEQSSCPSCQHSGRVFAWLLHRQYFRNKAASTAASIEVRVNPTFLGPNGTRFARAILGPKKVSIFRAPLPMPLIMMLHPSKPLCTAP